MCDVAHSHVWHNLSVHSFVTYNSYIYMCVTWLECVRVACQIHVPLDHLFVALLIDTCVTWRIRACDVGHSYVWRDLCVHSQVIWLIYTDLWYDSYTLTCSWYDSYTLTCSLVIWLIYTDTDLWLVCAFAGDMTHIQIMESHYTHMMESHHMIWLIYIRVTWHDSYMCVPWHDMTHICVCRDIRVTW